ncbi:Transmembrane amino acid transporter domain-containing protein [Forsythia ovata]|uniref:Transmembrane amino acid transporter domain-containing protein n=1 Tax=Forsythia ovata TaxID=205694 RepID=A0ABD1NUE8_9LAMI
MSRGRFGRVVYALKVEERQDIRHYLQVEAQPKARNTGSEAINLQANYSKCFDDDGRLKRTVLASNHVPRVSDPAAKSLLETDFVGGSGKSNNFGIQNVVVSGKKGILLNGFENVGFYEERKLQGSEIGTDEYGSSELICKTMHGWKECYRIWQSREKGPWLGITSSWRLCRDALEMI